jgi:hypothetical protein
VIKRYQCCHCFGLFEVGQLYYYDGFSIYHLQCMYRAAKERQNAIA